VNVSNKTTLGLGPNSGQLRIHTTNEVQPVLEIPISLEVIGQIVVEPTRLFFGHMRQGSEAKKEIRLACPGKPFNILGATSNLQFIQILRETKAAGETHALMVSIAADAPAGRFKGKITIQTDNQYQPGIEIPVIGKITATER